MSEHGRSCTRFVSIPSMNPVGLSPPMSEVTDTSVPNSFMSIRVKLSSDPKYSSASAFAVSVFPTPVVPRKRNVPMGFLRLPMSRRPRFIAFTMLWMASVCPTMRFLSCSSKSSSFFFSSPASPRTSMCALALTISRMSASFTIVILRDLASATASSRISTAFPGRATEPM